MNALEMLHDRHNELLTLVDRVRAANDDERAPAFVALATSMIAYGLLEKEMFFPACERRGIDDDRSLLHQELTLSALDDAAGAFGTDTFLFEMISLRDALAGHVVHEEEVLFPEVEATFLRLELSELATRMHGRLAQIMTELAQGKTAGTPVVHLENAQLQMTGTE